MDDQQHREDRVRQFVVERVVRDDGRYLLYYSWPVSAAADATRPAEAVDPTEAARDDV